MQNFFEGELYGDVIVVNWVASCCKLVYAWSCKFMIFFDAGRDETAQMCEVLEARAQDLQALLFR